MTQQNRYQVTFSKSSLRLHAFQLNILALFTHSLNAQQLLVQYANRFSLISAVTNPDLTTPDNLVSHSAGGASALPSVDPCYEPPSWRPFGFVHDELECVPGIMSFSLRNDSASRRGRQMVRRSAKSIMTSEYVLKNS
jgi:hypothetical protein